MIEKKDIQKMLDAAVKEYRKHKTINVYCGLPIEDLTHEELLAVTGEIIAERDAALRRANFAL